MKYALSYRMAWGFFLLGAVLFFIGAAMSMMQVEEISVGLFGGGHCAGGFRDLYGGRVLGRRRPATGARTPGGRRP